MDGFRTDPRSRMIEENPRTTGRKRRIIMSVLATLSLPLAGTVVPAAMTPIVGAAPIRHMAPAPDATLQKVEWISNRRVHIWVNSPAMGIPIQVQLLLARDWNTKPEAKFPALFMLDGMRATDIENGWTHDADAEDYFPDKNVNVVLPVGGQSSFYSDWLEADNGVHYMWETFLIRELPPILENQFRTSTTRAVAGLSMGGTAAMNLAARNPGFFKWAASYSGILNTTGLGMPEAIDYALDDAGGFDSTKMWGDPTNPQWAAHDPMELADKLKGVGLYVSSGSGGQGQYDEGSDIPGISSNYAGMGLEVLSRLTTQNFAAKLAKLSIPAQTVYRPSGTHAWPYWQFEMKQSWPKAAAALGVEAEKPTCNVGGAIAGVVAALNTFGDCLTPEYNSGGGIAQDFRYGRMFYSATAGTHGVYGAIGGAYTALGGAAGPLGLPTGDELPTPDGRAKWQAFEKGAIYWTPETGARAIRGAIHTEWSKQGYEVGPLGYPLADEAKTPGRDGVFQPFEGGVMYFSVPTGAASVRGEILKKYSSLANENGWLGFPRTSEATLKDGAFNVFEFGVVYWNAATGAWTVHGGPIFDAWKAERFEAGRLGYPTADQTDGPDGAKVQAFQHGTITQFKDGKTEVKVNDAAAPPAPPAAAPPAPPAPPAEPPAPPAPPA